VRGERGGREGGVGGCRAQLQCVLCFSLGHVILMALPYAAEARHKSFECKLFGLANQSECAKSKATINHTEKGWGCSFGLYVSKPMSEILSHSPTLGSIKIVNSHMMVWLGN
jgi:hypothetical protein